MEPTAPKRSAPDKGEKMHFITVKKASTGEQVTVNISSIIEYHVEEGNTVLVLPNMTVRVQGDITSQMRIVIRNNSGSVNSI